ncbi:MAG: hypothetical protein ABS935_04580 [Solibacillus sp.]|uniref:hypothetical protein n=1 Tax=Solibacillus sp. TaxID=1909654 RepID=UPI003314D323
MKHNYFKLNEDDIISILKDYLLTQLDYNQSQGNLALVQSENNEIQLIAAFGEASDDSIHKLDLKNLASTIPLNGPISALMDESQFNLNSPEAKTALEKFIEKLENEGI